MMSKYFEEARLVITADIVYDPDEIGNDFHMTIDETVHLCLANLNCLTKNLDVRLEGFICDDNSST